MCDKIKRVLNTLKGVESLKSTNTTKIVMDRLKMYQWVLGTNGTIQSSTTAMTWLHEEHMEPAPTRHGSHEIPSTY